MYVCVHILVLYAFFLTIACAYEEVKASCDVYEEVKASCDVYEEGVL